MTLIAAWLNMERPEYPEIWCMADTAITDDSGPTLTNLTNVGSKVLEINIVCKHLPSRGTKTVYHRSSVGYAYAGSTLIGLNVHATLCTLLSSVGSRQTVEGLPKYQNIVALAKQALELHSNHIRNNGIAIMLFGFCPNTKEPFICTLKREMLQGEVTYTESYESKLVESLSCQYIGDQKGVEALKSAIAIQSKLVIDRSIDYWRTPATSLKQIIFGKEFEPAIGGGLQICIINKDYFEHVFTLGFQYDNLAPMFKDINLHSELNLNLGNECFISLTGLDL